MTTENKIGAAGVSKTSLRQSKNISENPIINKLINNITKHSNAQYVSAIERSKIAPLDELQRRVFKRLRPMLGVDRYMELQNAVSAMNPLDRQDCLNAKLHELNERLRNSIKLAKRYAKLDELNERR